MKWLKNFAWKTGLGPLPSEVKPPMPECKPPKQTLEESNISEPVITLLEELKKGVWDVTERDYHDHNSVVHVLTHSKHKNVVLKTKLGFVLYESGWMTTDEQIAVQNAVEKVVRCQLDFNETRKRINERSYFAKALGVSNEIL